MDPKQQMIDALMGQAFPAPVHNPKTIFEGSPQIFPYEGVGQAPLLKPTSRVPQNFPPPSGPRMDW